MRSFTSSTSHCPRRSEVGVRRRPETTHRRRVHITAAGVVSTKMAPAVGVTADDACSTIISGPVNLLETATSSRREERIPQFPS